MTRKQRRYSPTVELLEAVRLLSSATEAHPLARLAVAEHDLLADLPGAVSHAGDDATPFSTAAWDEALAQTEVSDILGTAGASSSSSTVAPSATKSSPTVLSQPAATVD